MASPPTNAITPHNNDIQNFVKGDLSWHYTFPDGSTAQLRDLLWTESG